VLWAGQEGDQGSHSEWRGQIDEVMLFSRALHETEISSIFQVAPAVVISPDDATLSCSAAVHLNTS
jgi:hypothetical protein